MSATTLSAKLPQGYLYGFPLVFNLDQMRRYVATGVGANPAAAFNTFSHARSLAGPADTFVSINNDTVYSMAQLDLSVGPVELHVPDTRGRYYVLQFVDAWTDNFAYVGHRGTGTKEGLFFLVPPEWKGDAPEGSTVIRFPTTVASIVGRWSCEGPDDLSNVHALQDATTLTQVDAAAVPSGLRIIDHLVDKELLFLEKLRVWSQQFPPAPRDLPLQESLSELGTTTVGDSPFAHPDPIWRAELLAGLAVGKALLQKILTSGSSPLVNGWKLTFGAFNYNLDFFEVGALDDPAFQIADPKLRIAERAAAAIGGLWGNHAYEAAYIMTYLDNNGEELTGERDYTFTLDPTPPVSAFWSLTMYSVPDFYLVENEIDRYSLSDRTPGVIRGEDGSLTVFISATKPEHSDAQANWLPAPAGQFRPLLRMYEPDGSILDQTYVVPAIVRSRVPEPAGTAK